MNSATGGGFALAPRRDRSPADDCTGGATVPARGATRYPVCAEQQIAGHGAAMRAMIVAPCPRIAGLHGQVLHQSDNLVDGIAVVYRQTACQSK
ncbi:hypothetical protein [Burkholderia territorii]|uniref:hypothetical protein n=1 Tax=Burkholderia territorii TaxID=1503055 RepID=UPI000AD291DA|nr:hypothetical protein [Burkholderia territorii]